MRILLIVALLFGLRCFAAESSAAAEASALIFAGYANFPGGPVFVLHDPSTQESSPWMSLSQVWHGYALMTFEPKGEKLTLRKDAKNLTLTLKPSKIVEAFLRPRLVKGTYVITDDRIVYSADAELSVGQGLIISAAQGVMTANLEQTTVSGAPRLRHPDGTIMTTRDAMFEMNGGKSRMRVQGGVTIERVQPESGEKKPWLAES